MAVRGNCDFGSALPPAGDFTAEGVKIFYTHGHLYGVKSEYDRLAEAAQARGADVALFGHTHHRTLVYDKVPDVPTLFNPGSLRDEGCYGVITVRDGRCSYEWKNVPQ